jgi:hypothetical protein
MTRWIIMFLLASAAVAMGVRGVLCGTPENLDLRAMASIGSLQAGDEPEMPVESGTVVHGQKSVTRAMLLSALLPGLGQIYASGTRGYVTGGFMAATDIFSMWNYFDNNGKGDDKRRDYESFGKQHYERDRFNEYVRDTVVVYSGSSAFGFCEEGETHDEEECLRQINEVFPLSGVDDGTFFEQIDLDDRYVFGWDDWDPYGTVNHEQLWIDWNPYGDLPDGIPASSSNRDTFRNMREEADDFYEKADRYAWIMVIGRVVSMVDAAILVKLRNRDLAGIGSNPRLTFRVSMHGNPDIKVGLKMRF